MLALFRSYSASRSVLLIILTALGLHCKSAIASQIYEPMTAATRHALQRAVSDQAVEGNSFESDEAARHWVATMSERLRGRLVDAITRVDFLRTVHYEAKRAGLDPQLVLAVIQVE